MIGTSPSTDLGRRAADPAAYRKRLWLVFGIGAASLIGGIVLGLVLVQRHHRHRHHSSAALVTVIVIVVVLFAAGFVGGFVLLRRKGPWWMQPSPIVELPRSDRKALVKGMRKGQPVADARLLPYGRDISDRFQRRRWYMLGVTGFVALCLVPVAVENPLWALVIVLMLPNVGVHFFYAARFRRAIERSGPEPAR